MRTKERKIRGTRTFYVTGVVLTIIIAGSVIWLNWNQVSIRKYEMSAAFDGKAPWGDVGPESGTEKAPTVLYRKVGQSYCYTAFQVPSLRDRLESENKLLVSVEYNVFKTFGHEGRYTLRSVDGVPLAVGDRIVQSTREFGGQVLLNSEDTLACP